MFRNIVLESINDASVIAARILKKMHVADADKIRSKQKETSEVDTKLVGDIIFDYYPKYDDLDQELQTSIATKVWNKLLQPDDVVVATESEEPQPTKEEIIDKIIDYLKSNGAVLYPLEDKAKELADVLMDTNTQDIIQDAE